MSKGSWEKDTYCAMLANTKKSAAKKENEDWVIIYYLQCRMAVNYKKKNSTRTKTLRKIYEHGLFTDYVERIWNESLKSISIMKENKK